MSPKTLIRLALAFVAMVLMAEIATAAANTTDEEIEKAWEKWKNRFGTNDQYYMTRDVEGKSRYNIFANNYKFIQNFNANKNRSFKVGINKFADLTNQEFVAAFTGYKKSSQAGRDLEEAEEVSTRNVTFVARDLPATVDWRTQNVLTPVKDQKQCGSCWAFSATGAIEAQWVLAGNPMVSLSEQNLVDCSSSYGNRGCNGGIMQSAYKYIVANNGIESEADYPYRASGPNACSYSASQKAATISSYKTLARGDESALQEAVVNVGPISVAIMATSAFQFYKSGVFYDASCGSSLNHAVLAVGYGTSGGSDYWLIKNSWGTSWGQNGYGMMSRNRNNNCGIATDASYPLVPGRTTSTTGYTSGATGSGSGSATSGTSGTGTSGSTTRTTSGTSGSGTSGGSTTGGGASKSRAPSRSRTPAPKGNKWCWVRC